MDIWLVVAVIMIISALGFFLTYYKVERARHNAEVKFHSRPIYYAWWVALSSFIPGIIVYLLWRYVGHLYWSHSISVSLANLSDGANSAKSYLLDDIYSIKSRFQYLDFSQLQQLKSSTISGSQFIDWLAAKDVALGIDVKDYMLNLAVKLDSGLWKVHLVGAIIAIALSIVLGAWAIFLVTPKQRARTHVERLILVSLVLASTVAVLTTLGIVLSMLFQTVQFFEVVSWKNFFFGTVWDPRFVAAGSSSDAGQFGLVPLLAGTLYIALVAMLFAVPIGLFAAIYMSQYASKRFRLFVKPLLEFLAGIPTIVYGFFALAVVGPFLRDLSIALVGGQGFIMSQSVLTAGLVMGVMLIPYVSSLSDDILSAVPSSLKEGSLGLGATQSETIRKVVLPAALPGVVSAILLTASRAIGETMIVTLAAGVAPNLTWNPFEAMTTITVKIVSQLTGDSQFSSPQTLVAFALGLTLFILTLLMNIFALYITRKYQERYD